MTKEPLFIRLAFRPHYVAVARLVTYAGLAETTFWDKYKELCDQYGQPKMQAAVTELVTVDKTTTPATVRLTPEVRRYCVQILGVPPERKHEYDLPPVNLDPLPKPEESQTKPKRTRKKK